MHYVFVSNLNYDKNLIEKLAGSHVVVGKQVSLAFFSADFWVYHQLEIGSTRNLGHFGKFFR